MNERMSGYTCNGRPCVNTKKFGGYFSRCLFLMTRHLFMTNARWKIELRATSRKWFYHKMIIYS